MNLRSFSILGFRQILMLRAGICVLIFGAAAFGQPVAAVLATGGATLLRAGDELALSARNGDLLYQNDSLRVESGSLTLLSCGEGQKVIVQSGSVVRISASGTVVTGASERQRVAHCVLPPVPRDGGGVTSLAVRSGDPEQQIDIAAALAKLPPAELEGLPLEDSSDPATLLAQAAALAKYGAHAAAASAYNRIDRIWPDAGWPRKLVHEQLELERRTVAPASGGKGSGKTWAVIVGISRYPQLRGSQQLRYAAEDARLFAEHLQSPKGGALSPEQIRLLVDEQATTAAVRSAITTFLARSAGPSDTVILFIAAHGTVDAQDGYILTHDSNPEDLRLTALPMIEVQNLLDGGAARAGRVQVFIDVCRAGTIGTLVARNTINERLDTALRSKVETFGILASGPGEYSLESDRFGGGHGAFSYFLVRGLGGEADDNSDGEVTSGELVDYVRAKVQQATRKRQTPRETGNMTGSVVLTADTDQPGPTLRDWRPVDAAALKRAPQAVPVVAASATKPGRRSAMDADVAEFEDALEAGRVYPETPSSAFAALNRIRRRLGDPTAVAPFEERLRVAIEERGQHVLNRYLKGEQVPQQRLDFLEGELLFRAALLLDPSAWKSDSRAAFCLGRARMFEKRYDEAVRLLETAVRVDGAGAYAFNALGIAYLEGGAYDRAVAAFRDAARRAPAWAYPLHNLALALAERGDFDAAAGTFQQALRTAPQYAYIPYSYGMLMQRLNRLDEATALYRKALEIDGASADAHNALGSVLATSGRRKQAEQHYRVALDLRPGFRLARYNLAVLLATRADGRNEAIRLHKQNLAEDATFTPSAEVLSALLAASGHNVRN